MCPVHGVFHPNFVGEATIS